MHDVSLEVTRANLHSRSQHAFMQWRCGSPKEASGILEAIKQYYSSWREGSNEDSVIRFVERDYFRRVSAALDLQDVSVCNVWVKCEGYSAADPLNALYTYLIKENVVEPGSARDGSGRQLISPILSSESLILEDL